MLADGAPPSCGGARCDSDACFCLNGESNGLLNPKFGSEERLLKRGGRTTRSEEGFRGSTMESSSSTSTSALLEAAFSTSSHSSSLVSMVVNLADAAAEDAICDAM